VSGLFKTWKTSSKQEPEAEPAINHPDKIIFPEKGITKNQVIGYYQSVGPLMMQWINGQLLSLVRFPNGLNSPGFFQKNAPANAPKWIKTKRWGIEVKKDYMVADSTHTLEWLAGIGTIEFHILGLRPPDYKKHSLLFFDLDPPASMQFSEVLSFSQLFHEHLQSEGLKTFIKTSGKNGVHLICPVSKKQIAPDFDYAMGITQSFLSKNPGLATTELRKIKRGQRLFIDVYRNHPGQTLVAPLSLRATPTASVSMPLDWSELNTVESPAEFNLSSVLKLLSGKKWKPWKNFGVQ